uniref:Pco104930 n=1 Tax=Arundo donax TaxID=35708 RepID=A0A0A9GSH9_ARUDO
MAYTIKEPALTLLPERHCKLIDYPVPCSSIFVLWELWLLLHFSVYEA